MRNRYTIKMEGIYLNYEVIQCKQKFFLKNFIYKASIYNPHITT